MAAAVIWDLEDDPDGNVQHILEHDVTVEEYEVMKAHTTKGVEIVEPLKLSQAILEGIRSHHETYIGSGYPQGLKGENIPITAAIIAVAGPMSV